MQDNKELLIDKSERRAATNRRLAQWRVTWLIEHSTSHQLLWCIDSFVLRNPPLRQAPKRYIKLSEKFIGKHGENLQFCRSLENLVVFRNY